MKKCKNCGISVKKGFLEQKFIDRFGECARCYNGDDNDRELLRTVDPSLREFAEICIDSKNLEK